MRKWAPVNQTYEGMERFRENLYKNKVAQIVISALLGIFGVAAALNGYLFRPIPTGKQQQNGYRFLKISERFGRGPFTG